MASKADMRLCGGLRRDVEGFDDGFEKDFAGVCSSDSSFSFSEAWFSMRLRRPHLADTMWEARYFVCNGFENRNAGEHMTASTLEENLEGGLWTIASMVSRAY